MDEFAGSGGFGAVEEAVIAASAGFSAGLVLGIRQWAMLQRRIPRAGWWVLASAIGAAVGLVVVDATDLGTSPITFDGSRFGLQVGAVTGVMVGASIGVAQWLVLRRWLSRAGWWILTSVAGWTTGWAVGWAVGGVGHFVVPGVLGGTFTGAALVWLLQRQQRDAGSEEM